MTSKGRGSAADEYVNEIASRIDQIKKRIESGELKDEELIAARNLLGDMNDQLETRVKEIKAEKASFKPKKLFGFI